MQEKIVGVSLVTKLRFILLLEVDYNYHSRLIFGQRMMDLARKCGIVPDEIYSAIVGLTCQASGVPASSVRSMLKPMGEMEFFVKTAFGESETYVGGKDNLKQDSGQGNGAAPPTW